MEQTLRLTDAHRRTPPDARTTIQKMRDAVSNVDLTKGTVPILKMLGALIFVGSCVWWAATMNASVNNMNATLASIKEDVSAAAKLRYEVDSQQRQLDAYRSELATTRAWLQTAQIKLAEQQFETPPLNFGPLPGDTQ